MSELNSQATTLTNMEFWGKYPELNGRPLNVNAADAELRKEWNAIYAKYLQEEAKEEKPLTVHSNRNAGDGYEITENVTTDNVQKLKIALQPKPPEIVDGFWLGKEHKKSQIIGFGETIKIYVKTQNVPDYTELTIKIKEYDPGWNWDEQIDSITGIKVVADEATVDLVLDEKWYDAENDGINELYFSVFATIDDNEIEKELPKKTQDYLQVALPVTAVIGIHSVVENDTIGAGHAWISFTKDGVTTTYGLWPDGHRKTPDDPEGVITDIRKGFEDSVKQKFHSRYYSINKSREKIFADLITKNIEWAVTHTCAAWASDVFIAVTGEDVDADDAGIYKFPISNKIAIPIPLFGVETPRELIQSIQELEAKDPTTLEKPHRLY
jgi:hypothetical protein